MPLFMDRHYIEGATQHAIQTAHTKDLEIQDKYLIKFLTYWFDEARSTTFCLVDSPNKEAIQHAHAEAHGSVPNEIIEVNPAVVEAFLGRIQDPAPVSQPKRSPVQVDIDSAFRTIMCTDLKESTAMTVRLGDAKAMQLLHIHNDLTRNALMVHDGREVRHTGDGIISSFTSAAKAVECAIAIQKAFSAHNERHPDGAMYVRIGLSAGEPVEEDNSLFGTTVILSVRICAYAQPSQIMVAQVVKDTCQGSGLEFSELGEATLKGFSQPIRLFEVRWQSE
jgi:class 3 adenylate cyclase